MKIPLRISLFIIAISVLVAPLTGYDEEALFERLDADEQETLRCLHILMNPFQQKQYLSLPTREARAAWVERFWIELDPTPTTARNERRIEHEQRLAYVREHFPSSGEPGWDRRGEIYILYGEPDVRTIIGAELVHPSVYPPKEKWHYRALNTYVTFEDLTHNGEYTYEILSYSTGRIMSPRGADPDFNLSVFSRTPLGYMPSLDATEKEFSNPRKQPYCHTCDLVMNRFPLYFDVSSFRGGPGTVMTEVSFEVPAKDIIFVQSDGASRAEVDFRVMVRNFSFDSVTAGATRVSAAVTGEEALEKLDRLDGQLRLSLEPGYYRFGIEAIDRNARRSCAYNTIVTIQGMDSSPALSDIQFARLIREAEGDERFTKGGLQIVPHPLHAYRIPDPVRIYFEIYGLETDRNDVAFYSIEYRVEPLDKRRWGPVLVEDHLVKSSTFDLSGYGSRQVQRLEIDTSDLWPGRYELQVLVRDRATLAETSRETPFSIVDR